MPRWIPCYGELPITHPLCGAYIAHELCLVLDIPTVWPPPMIAPGVYLGFLLLA